MTANARLELALGRSPHLGTRYGPAGQGVRRPARSSSSPPTPRRASTRCGSRTRRPRAESTGWRRRSPYGTKPGDTVVIRTPERLRPVPPLPRRGPGRVCRGAGQRPDPRQRDRPRRRRRRCVTRHPVRRRPRRRPVSCRRSTDRRARRPRGALLHLGHDRSIEGRPAHAPRARRRRPRASGCRRSSARTRPSSACLSPTSTASSPTSSSPGSGVPAYTLPRFRPVEVLDAIESRRASIFLGVPAMYRMLLEAGAENRDLRCVRVWISGADVMPDDLAARSRRWGHRRAAVGRQDRSGAVRRGIRHGRARRRRRRASSPAAPDRRRQLPASAPGWEVKIDAANGEVGELLVRGPGVMQGYHNAPEATAAVLDDDGWVRTGDLVRSGPLGTIIFEGRAKDVVKHGGYSVYAPEVERVDRGAPRGRRGRARRYRRRAQGRGAGRRRAAARRSDGDRGRVPRLRRRASLRLQGADPRRLRATRCPGPAVRRSRRASSRSSSTPRTRTQVDHELVAAARPPCSARGPRRRPGTRGRSRTSPRRRPVPSGFQTSWHRRSAAGRGGPERRPALGERRAEVLEVDVAAAADEVLEEHRPVLAIDLRREGGVDVERRVAEAGSRRSSSPR